MELVYDSLARTPYITYIWYVGEFDEIFLLNLKITSLIVCLVHAVRLAGISGHLTLSWQQKIPRYIYRR